MPTSNEKTPAAELSDAKKHLLIKHLQGVPLADRASGSIQPRAAGAKTPLSAEQSSVWLQATLERKLPIYNEAVTVRFRGELHAPVLEQSLNFFIARHEIWRTTFQQMADEVVQQVEPEVRLALTLVDLRAHPDVEGESSRIASAQACLPLDLEQAPLLRATLLQLSAEESRLHLVISHLIVDSFSLRRTFLPELRHIYAAFALGRQPSLPAVSLHYADYALWRNQQAASSNMDAPLAYWKHQLAGDLALLSLPTDRSRPKELTRRGDMRRFNLPPHTVQALRRLVQHSKTSLYTVLLTALKVLLFRYSGQEDVIVGTVADGRRRPELEAVMGCVMDVFPVRTRPRAALSFLDYLKQVHETFLDGLAMCEPPLAHIVDAAGVTREHSHQPIFQTLFAFQPNEAEADCLWSVTGTEIATSTSKFDLCIEADEQADEQADRIGVRIFFSTDLFDVETIYRLIGHWETLLHGVCANPECVIGDLPLLTATEQQTMQSWNATKQPLPQTTIHDLILAQGKRTPNRTAITWGATGWTYARLMDEAEQIAAALLQAGITRHALVATVLGRSPSLVASLLGILMTGAAYMPIDPATPTSRIALCFESARPDWVLAERSYLGVAAMPSGRTLVLEDVLAAPRVGVGATISSGPDDLAYVLYTSGSTGVPKGVEIVHRGVVNLLLSMQHDPGFNENDSILAITTISFDISVLEMFLPLISGGRIVLASREDATDPAKLGRLIDSGACTYVQATPATWTSLLESGWQGKAGLRVLCGGEAMSRSLAEQLLAQGMDVWNVYGPTETTVWSTIGRVKPSSGAVSVGQPIANTTTYILDARQRAVPIGVAGELYLGGSGLAKGYRNLPAVTDEKFITVDAANGERLYRTGDVAVYRGEGEIELRGRLDNQVKIRGHRVELDEVEVNLAAHPAVAFAAARVWADSSGGNTLTAYLVGQQGTHLLGSEVRDFLRSRLPAYMVPTQIIFMAAMPLTPSGKVDRSKLTKPEQVEAVEQDVSHPTERRMARVWAQILGVRRVGRNDSFFDLGGHSLLLLKLLRAVNQEFETKLDLPQLFEAPTVTKLARLISGLDSPQNTGSLVTLNPYGTARPLFMVHSHMLYGRLPGALGFDQPFYGLKELPPGDDLSPGFIDSLLDEHVRQVRSIQPHGPYQIAGWCFAGLMAYEVARRLETAGEQVSTLFLLDSWCPYTTPRKSRKAYIAERSSVALAKGIHRFVERVANRCLGTLVILRMQAIRASKSLLYRLFSSMGFQHPAALASTDILGYEWLRNYHILPYRGDITLVLPAKSYFDPQQSDTSCGWAPFTSGLVRHLLAPGDRQSMFLEPNVASLAAALKRHMRESLLPN